MIERNCDGVLNPAGVPTVMTVAPVATAWKVELALAWFVANDSGVVTVPAAVFELDTSTCAETPGRNGWYAIHASVEASSTAGATVTCKSAAPTVVEKSPLAITKPEAPTVTFTVTVLYPGAWTVSVVEPTDRP